MASITKRGDQLYQIRISRGSRSQRRVYRFTFRGSLRAARAFALEREREIDSGTIQPGTQTVAMLARQWLAAIQSKVRPRTLDGYRGYLERYAMPQLGALDAATIRAHHIQSIYSSLSHLSPTTIRQLHATLRAMFTWAERMQAININPCLHLDLPARRRAEVSIMTVEEAARFIAACRDLPNGLVFEFALETGMRPEEYLALRWSDLRGDDACIEQIVQYNRRGGGFYFDQPKTSRSRRRVPLSGELRERLSRHRIEQMRHRLALPVSWHNLDLIFPNAVGRPQSLTNLSRRSFRAILHRAGIEKRITLYSLRHTCATLLLMSGVNPKVVADRLGHASVTMTLDIYSHVLPHIQADATDRLRALINQKV